MSMEPGVVRYVVTYVNPEGMRELWDAMQGRYTYSTREEAQARIDAVQKNNAPHILAKFGPLEVRPVECYPVHFDPKTRYFD